MSWIDTRWDSAVGLFQAIQHPIARRLQCSNPHSVDKYVTNLEYMLDQANIVDKILNLEQIATVPLTDGDILLCVEIGLMIIHCMENAEKKRRKLYMGGVPLSLLTWSYI